MGRENWRRDSCWNGSLHTILKILNGSGKTRNDVVVALQKFHGKGELALGFLLEWFVTRE
jgi:hypothetical protein